MAPALLHHARSLLEHALATRQPDTLTSLGPLAAHKHLFARDSSNSNRPNPESGIVHAKSINNKFIFVLFGLLGASFVCLGIWFFFWARNGGFYFKETDWDDYKSTVLRRKGPNGTTLSGATTETDLGGGSVYKDLDADTSYDNGTVISGTTGITGGVSDIVGRERRRKKREQKEREKERRREEKRREKEEKKRSKSGRKVGEDGAVIDEEAEAEAAEYLRNYRHEKPARVGGINRESEASEWDGSTNPTESSRGGYTESTVTSELISNRERDRSPPKKSGGGIRKVYSTADKRDSRETERIRAEARKLQEKGRAARSAASASSSGHRRNFSWQQDNRVDEDTAMIPPPTYTPSEVETRIPGSWTESDVGSEVGTKSYHHVIPGLSSVGSSSGAGSSVAGTDVRDYAEEKRKKRGGAGGNRREGGYRRER